MHCILSSRSSYRWLSKHVQPVTTTEELKELSEVQLPRCLQLNREVQAVTQHTLTYPSLDPYGVATEAGYR